MGAPAFGIALEESFEQGVFGPEVAVDQPVSDAGFLGDRAQRDLGGTGRGKEPLGSIQYGVGDLLLAGGPSRTRGSHRHANASLTGVANGYRVAPKDSSSRSHTEGALRRAILADLRGTDRQPDARGRSPDLPRGP